MNSVIRLPQSTIMVGDSPFMALFQPIVRRRSAAVDGHELLLRPVREDGSPAPTAGGLDRLDVREAGDLDTKVLAWLLEAAGADLLPRSPMLFVNVYLSTLVLRRTEALERLERVNRTLNGAFGLEINEESYRDMPRGTIETLKAVRQSVPTILLDDLDGGHDLGEIERIADLIDGVKMVHAEASVEHRGWLRDQAFQWAVCERGPGEEPFTHEQYFEIGRPTFAGT